MENIKLFVKGLFIGFGKIIPGVSGSLIAICLNVYEDALNRLSNFFSGFKSNLLYFIFLGSGIAFSIIFFSNILLFLFNKYFLIMMSLVIGFLIGVIPKMYKEIEFKNITAILYFLVPLFLFQIFKFNINIKESFFSYILLGSIEALTTIIPGISGTAIYIMLNCYDNILKIFSNPLSFEFIIFFISFGISFILLARIINFFLKKYKNESKIIIFFFLLFSIIMILKNIQINLISLAFIIIGYVISKKINSYLE